jgi:FkbM family methyltransferase
MLQEITFDTTYGKITLPINQEEFVDVYKQGRYWNEHNLLNNFPLIDPNKNILEFGSHCGTDTIAYASKINDNCKVYSFEPQSQMFYFLQKNISDNNLQNKIISENACLFHYTGDATMNASILDGPYRGNLSELDSTKIANYGGLCLGKDGESVKCYKMDDLNLENIGFIHSDAQGAEPYIFWGAKETIRKFRPIIFYENAKNESYLFENIKKYYDVDSEIYNFSIKDFCINELGYRQHIEGNDSYLIP